MLRFFPSSFYHAIFLSLFLLLPFTRLQAQQISKIFNDTAVVADGKTTVSADPVMAQRWNQIQGKFITMNLGFAFLLDHNILNQDDNTLQLLGLSENVPPATEFRGQRLVLSGNLFASAKNPWRYMVSANYNGLDAPQDKKFDMIDWNIEIPLSARAGWLTVGKQKEGASLEYIAPGTQMQFTERSTGAPMLVRQRNIGLKYSNAVLGKRLFYSLGFFNNYWETGKSFSDNGSQVVARVAGLPHYKSDRELLHLGVAYRYTDANSGKLSYKAKPEANSAPFYLNTGSFDASSAGTLFFELVAVKGPLMILGEYMHCNVNSESFSDPGLNSFHIGGSWFITGENRRYNRQVGNPGKLIPKKNFRFKKGSGTGAFEVGARYSRADASDRLVNGGVFGRFTTALSWYPNAHFRYEINFGKGTLEKDGLKGKTTFWQLRAQYEL